MTAIKKNTAKASKSPAPATKGTVATKKVAATSSVPTTPAIARTSTVSAVKTAPVVTTITARIDVGFGNAVYVRGSGPGLSWDNGVPMACVSSDEWQLTLGESVRPITFKLLVNDIAWSLGDDFAVAAGDRVTITPAF
jgi:hypothetical protein